MLPHVLTRTFHLQFMLLMPFLDGVLPVKDSDHPAPLVA